MKRIELSGVVLTDEAGGEYLDGEMLVIANPLDISPPQEQPAAETPYRRSEPIESIQRPAKTMSHTPSTAGITVSEWNEYVLEKEERLTRRNENRVKRGHEAVDETITYLCEECESNDVLLFGDICDSCREAKEGIDEFDTPTVVDLSEPVTDEPETVEEKIKETLDTPIFSEVDTDPFTNTVDIEIDDDPNGATIYYTTNGDDPDSLSSEYDGTPITLNVSTTLKAIAILDGYKSSDIAESEFEIKLATPVPPTPSASDTDPFYITLTCTYGPTATIKYTTDGTDPKTSGTASLYATPFVLAGSKTVKAYAFKTGCTDSDIKTQAYTIYCATPTITITTDPMSSGDTITLACVTAGTTMKWEYDVGSGRTTTHSGAAPITITPQNIYTEFTTVQNITVYARAEKTGYSNSVEASYIGLDFITW